MRSPIPSTALVERYKRLKVASQRRRLEAADRLMADPSVLAAEFAQSVAGFSAYDNRDEPFYSQRGADYSGQIGLNSTRQLAALLESQGPVWGVQDASNLDFDYVDRELVVARTTGDL